MIVGVVSSFVDDLLCCVCKNLLLLVLLWVRIREKKSLSVVFSCVAHPFQGRKSRKLALVRESSQPDCPSFFSLSS